jgi:hypothetical protein
VEGEDYVVVFIDVHDLISARGFRCMWRGIRGVFGSTLFLRFGFGLSWGESGFSSLTVGLSLKGA